MDGTNGEVTCSCWKSMMRVFVQGDRGRPAKHCWPSPGSPVYTVGCPGCDGRSCKHLVKCQQKRIAQGFSSSSSSRNVLGDVVMGEVPTPIEELLIFLSVEPPPVVETLSETDAMMLAAVRPYGHTLEDLPPKKW